MNHSKDQARRKINGADYHAKKDRWRGVIEFNRKVYRSSYFLTRNEAQEWYDAKSLELYGFDRINEPDIDATEVSNLASFHANVKPKSKLAQPKPPKHQKDI